MNTPSFTLLVAGDLHHQAKNRNSLFCARALELWALLMDHARRRPPAAILQLGDLIDGYELPIDVCKQDLLAVRDALAKSPFPIHAIVGNHETINLPDRAFMLETLGWSGFSRAVDFGALRVILFDLTVDGESYGLLTPERAVWLEAEVNREPTKPVLLLQHPLIHPDEEVCGHRHYVQNSGEYLRLLNRLPQIQMILTGHRHIPGLLRLRGTLPPSNNAGARMASLVQVTLPAFCSWPFTFGELRVDAAARQVSFAERPLEPLPGHAVAGELETLLTEGLKIKMRENPEVWGARLRLSPELQQVTVRWH